MSEGGFWNRAGRRSGGNRPLVIATLPAEITCANCKVETAFGLLPQRLVQDTLVRCCPKCEGVLLVHRSGRWVSGVEFLTGLLSDD